jgi:hypothetical protein
MVVAHCENTHPVALAIRRLDRPKVRGFLPTLIDAPAGHQRFSAFTNNRFTRSSDKSNFLMAAK